VVARRLRRCVRLKWKEKRNAETQRSQRRRDGTVGPACVEVIGCRDASVPVKHTGRKEGAARRKMRGASVGMTLLR
jgi:hypothetical protein